ncbi:MAG: hypothetical protein EOM64_09950 [Erysipelotrichia bacterium]|nr:hypothetical protein [Erysipelotrichia bacterium]
MITDAFSKEKYGVLNPDMCYAKSEESFQTMILTFSHPLIAKLLEEGAIEPSRAVIASIGGDAEIYRVSGHPGTAIVKIGMGAPHAVNMCEELAWITGAVNYIEIGSCGALDAALTAGKVIIPSKAWRDDGVSYHYAPAADWIEIVNSEMMAKLFQEWNVSFAREPVWTTDALYRETPEAVARHKAVGCVAVEMECSGIQAWADFRNLNYYPFFYSADALDESSWDSRILMSSGELDPACALFALAAQLASVLQKH